MHSRNVVRWLVVVAALLALPTAGYAQESAIVGTVTDATGGVLPGVTVEAQEAATGNTFIGVSDGTGQYRVQVRIGTYTLTAGLPGFTTVEQADIVATVGQETTVDVGLRVSTVEETVTVTGESALINVVSSTVGVTISDRQMEDIPLNGRNWMNLSMLAAGSRENEAAEVPQQRAGYFQVNVDSQQVTHMICCRNEQPRYSRDSIAEFEIITNRFDATNGRSAGMVVNAITKSGTNNHTGTISGYFRDDSFIAKDFILDRVVPYANQQLSFTYGGPIILDRMHIFANYEYEREPRTTTYNSAFPKFNIDQQGNRTVNTGALRFDAQWTSRSRFSARANSYKQFLPYSYGGGASRHPSYARHQDRISNQMWLTQTNVFGTSSVNELKGGFAIFDFTRNPTALWKGGPFPNAVTRDGAAPLYQFRGYNIGTDDTVHLSQGSYTIRDEFSTSFNAGGRHDMRVGLEFMYYKIPFNWCYRCMGRFNLNKTRPNEVAGGIDAVYAMFPTWNDVSTWDVTGLNPYMRHVDRAVGDFMWSMDRHVWATWFQDDWQATDNLTLNLGFRWDADIGGIAEEVKFEPWLSGNRPSDLNNFAPRLGFAYSLNDRTVVRGGWGLFFTELENDPQHQSRMFTILAVPRYFPDGRADFVNNPYGASSPTTLAEFEAISCDKLQRLTDCTKRGVNIEIPAPIHGNSYSQQASLGLQRQIGNDMSVEANYVYTGGRMEEERHNVNLNYNPATKANYSYKDTANLPFPRWGVVRLEFMNGYSNYHGLDLSFNKRFSNSWQANATYTLSKFMDAGSEPCNIKMVGGFADSCEPLGFTVTPDLGAEYTLAADDQRHRATFNGIAELPFGFQVSGLYFFASGQRQNISCGGDARSYGTSHSRRLCGNGTMTKRNDLVGSALHRIDMRLQKRINLGGAGTFDAMLEVFNLMNHANYGSYTTNIGNANFGKPTFNSNVAYQPRLMQLGFRLAF